MKYQKQFESLAECKGLDLTQEFDAWGDPMYARSHVRSLYDGFVLGQTLQTSAAVNAIYQPWKPMTDMRSLKTIGKLAEETSELGAAIARCIIQGVEEYEPVTGKSNRQWLEEEIADVEVNIKLVKEWFCLDKDSIAKRMVNKEPKLRGWHKEAV